MQQPFPPLAPAAEVPLDALRALARGPVIAPGDPDYDDARAVPVGGLDRHPAAIARAADTTDVQRIVAFASERGLPLAVRAGGHSMAGHGVPDGAVVLDLAGLDAIELDPAGRTAWAGGGVTAGAYTLAAAAHGLATPFGDTATVGVAGITLAGGIGYLVRRHGLTIDSLLGAEIVTADGTLHAVDAAREPDLFWAIRGGSGNVGVVTRLRYRLHPLETVLGGMLVLPATEETVAGFFALADAAPEELSIIAMVMNAPPMPFLPAEAHGRPILMALACWAGDLAAGERALAPFRALAPPLADMVGPKRYPELFPPEEGPRPPGVVRTLFAERIDAAAAGTILAHLEDAVSPLAVAQVRVLGGAMARVPAEATAFAHRSASVMVNVAAAAGDPAAQGAWVARLAAALDQGVPGAYAGFLGDEGPARVRAAYPGATWARLAAIKRRYDPDNLFRSNHNVPPADAEAETSTAA